MKFGHALIFLFAMMTAAHAADHDQRIRDGLSRLLPDMEIDSIKATPIDGLYQVILGPDIIYMTDDGKYVLQGDLLDISERRNLTEDVRAESRVELLQSIRASEYIEFAADEPRDTIYVFTDIDCGYCRKLHQDVPELNSRGISVRYLAYPRAGIESGTASDMESVWCADDRQAALTRAKNRESIDTKTCDNPIARQYKLGKKIGVRGTPAIYLESGKAIPGYMPPDRLVQAMRE